YGGRWPAAPCCSIVRPRATTRAPSCAPPGAATSPRRCAPCSPPRGSRPPGPSARSRARARATRARARLRAHGGIDALVQEYDLSPEEGVLLMCLAEALLRIPDETAQEALIREKLARGHWSEHLGRSHSVFVNASTWGLTLSG